MSFICDYCSKPTAPRIPLRLLQVDGEARPVEYRNLNRNKTEENDAMFIFSKGYEITAEYKVCPSCAGVVSKHEAKPDHTIHIALVRVLQAHGKNCKKKYEECWICQGNELKLRAISAPALNMALTEVPAQRVHVSLGSIAVDNLINRTMDETKRAKRDFEAAYPLLKGYEQRGHGL